MIELGLGSVAETYKFIKQFHFYVGQGFDLFNEMTFSDPTKIRVSPRIGHVALKRNTTTQFFPTDDNIWARTWVTNPLALRKLLMLQVFPNIQQLDTSVKIRLFDGTNDRFWDSTLVAANLVGGTVALPPGAGDTIVLSCDSEEDDQTVTFAGTETTVALVAQAINAQTTGITATVVGGLTVDLASDTENYTSTIAIVSDTGGGAVHIGHVAPSSAVGSGNNWAIANPSDATHWNTEGEINAHIETFTVLPNRTFAVTMNLKTTDHELTPEVTEIRVLMEVCIDYIEDIVLRSLLPALEGGIDPVANLAHVPPFTEDVSSINLGQYRTNISYSISDVVGVYDLTDDPERLSNQLDSYDPVTTVITLLNALPTGHRPLILIRYKPEVIFIQHQDWYEVAKVPCLLIQQLEVPFTRAYNLGAWEGIVDKGTGNAVRLQEPWRATFEFRIHGLTGGVVDEMRLMSRVIEFFEKNPMLRSTGLDEYYRMRIEREFRDLSSPSRSDQRAFWTRFTVEDVRMPFVSESAHAVRRVSLTFTGPKPPHEDPIKGGSRVVLTVHTEDGPVEFTETVEIT